MLESAGGFPATGHHVGNAGAIFSSESSNQIDTVFQKLKLAGIDFDGFDIITQFRQKGLKIIPESKAKDLASKLPAVPKSPSNHFANFLRSCKGEEKTRSPFSVAGPLCQAMALGIIAQQVGSKLVFDPATRQITNHKFANDLLSGVEPRKDWEQFYKL